MFVLRRYKDGCQSLMTGTRSYASLEVGQIYYDEKGWWGWNLVGGGSTVYCRTKKQCREILERHVTYSLRELAKQLGS